MGKKFFWMAASVLLAANVSMFASPADAAVNSLSVYQCACLYGGGPGGPEGPGTPACLSFFQSGCDGEGDECPPCAPV